MKSPFTMALVALLLSAAGKLVHFYLLDNDPDLDNYPRLWHFLVLVTLTYFGVRLYRQQQQRKSKFLQDLQAGVKVVATYAILLSIFTYGYYRLVDPEYFPRQIEKRVEAIRAQHIWDSFPENHPWHDLSEEEVLNKEREAAAVVLSPFSQSTITLFGVLFLGTLVTLILAGLFRTNLLWE